ncbi:MAG: zinc ribbon domain-containing protein, partial [Bacillota bacterium]
IANILRHKTSKPDEPKAKGSKRKEKSVYLLSELGPTRYIKFTVCGYCGSTIKTTIANSTKDNKNYYYFCALRHRSGASACPDSTLHRQDTINELVLNDLQETLRKNVKSLFSKYTAYLGEKLRDDLEAYSLQIAKMSHSKTLERDKITALLNEQLSLMNKSHEIPSFFFSLKDMESKRKSVRENIKSIILYSDKIELIYRYPIDEKFETKKTIRIEK